MNHDLAAINEEVAALFPPQPVKITKYRFSSWLDRSDPNAASWPMVVGIEARLSDGRWVHMAGSNGKILQFEKHEEAEQWVKDHPIPA